jgi:uncharacterized protein YhhL (DUF1145 family)
MHWVHGRSTQPCVTHLPCNKERQAGLGVLVANDVSSYVSCQVLKTAWTTAAGGPVFVPNTGYWHEAANSSSLQRCPNGAACAGNRSVIIACQSTNSCPTGDSYKTMQCSSGYRGNLCGSCRQDQGYTQNRYFRCSKCLSTAANIVLLLVFAVGACALVVFVSWKSWCDAAGSFGWPSPFATAHPAAAALEVQPLSGNLGVDSKLSLSDTFKVLIVYLQYLSIIGNLLVDWPPAAAFLFEAARAMFITNNSRAMSLGCFGTIGEGVRMLFMVLVPLFVVGAACWAMLRLLGRKPQQPRMQHNWSSRADLLISTALIGVFLFYSVLVGTTLSSFACMEAAGKLFWVRDLDLRCWHAEHVRASLALGLVGCVVLVVLMPAATITWLYRNKQQLQNPAFKRRYGFLYQLYQPQYCYWEGVVCLQTCALVAVDLFARRRGAFYQLLLMVLVLFANSTLANMVRPFRSEHQKQLYVASTTCLLLTCVGVLALLKGFTLEKDGGISESERNAVAVMVLLMNLVFVVVCVVLMAGTGIQVAKRSLPHVLGSRHVQRLKERAAAFVQSFGFSRREPSTSEASASSIAPDAPSGGAGLLEGLHTIGGAAATDAADADSTAAVAASSAPAAASLSSSASTRLV